MLKGLPDQPATKDLFEISNYVKGLCSFVEECETPMTIAIQGDWGSGKTSVMQMMQEHIAEEHKTVKCVWFNTWQFSQFNTSETLSLSLIRTVIDGLCISETDEANSLKDKLKALGNVIVRGGQRFAVYAAEKVSETAAEDLEEFLEKSAVEAISELRERFKKCIDKACREHNVTRVLVFVDDLDRLQPIRAVELLEVLKIFLDCENCVFVLALDYNVVISGIKQKYDADIAENKGKSFFDKIIQVPFKMPVAEYKTHDFIKETFQKMAGFTCTESDTTDLDALIKHSIGYNPRSMKRLFNSFALLLKVKHGELEDDRSKKVLFAILCMQQHFEELYNDIVMQIGRWSDTDLKNLLNGDNFEDDAGQIKTFMDCIKDVLGNVDKKSIALFRKLLNSSSATAAGPAVPISGKRISVEFEYQGVTYKSMTRNQRPAHLALELIKKYAQANSFTADELRDLINNKTSRKRPRAWTDKKSIEGNSFPGIPIKLKKLFVSDSWAHEEVVELIDKFNYENEATYTYKYL